MKLVPHCRRVKIRIESGGKDYASLEDLKRNFYIDDIIPLVRDGRLQRWLDDLDEKDLAQAVKRISAEASDENKKQTANDLLCTFLPQYFNGNVQEILLSVMLLHDNYNHEALFQIINIFKEDIPKDIILMFWDDLAELYSLEEFRKIVSPYKTTDKDIAYKLACFVQEERNTNYSDAMEVAAKLGHAKAIEIQKEVFETDCYSWRDCVKTDNKCPTTYAEVETLFTDTIPNRKQFCKFKPLELFYMDVWHIYGILKEPGFITNEWYEQMQHQIYERFGKNELEKDPMRIERDFIKKLIVWHKYNIAYPYTDVPYRESRLLQIKGRHRVRSKGYIDFTEETESFCSYSIWKQILYVTVNIFNKELYPDWK